MSAVATLRHRFSRQGHRSGPRQIRSQDRAAQLSSSLDAAHTPSVDALPAMNDVGAVWSDKAIG